MQAPSFSTARRRARKAHPPSASTARQRPPSVFSSEPGLRISRTALFAQTLIAQVRPTRDFLIGKLKTELHCLYPPSQWDAWGPDEIGLAGLFLASNDSSFVTSSTGMSFRMRLPSNSPRAAIRCSANHSRSEPRGNCPLHKLPHSSSAHLTKGEGHLRLPLTKTQHRRAATLFPSCRSEWNRWPHVRIQPAVDLPQHVLLGL